MRSKNLVIIVMLVLLMGNILVISTNKKVRAAEEIFVDDDPYLIRDGTVEHPYEKIQYAINKANPGDTIYVFGGNYNETLTIDKEITLIGGVDKTEGEGDSVVYYGNSHIHTITITAENVNFTGFNVTDLTNSIISQIEGSLIYITADNVIIENNNIYNGINGYGIYLKSNSNCLINKNIIENVTNGIYSEDSNTNEIVFNNIFECKSSCIKIKSSRYTNIYNNTLNNSLQAIYLEDCQQSNIIKNYIHSNFIRGLRDFSGSNNKIHDNSFIKNEYEGIKMQSEYCEITNNTIKGSQIGLSLESSNSRLCNNSINDSIFVGLLCKNTAKNNIIFNNNFYRNQKNAKDDGKNKWYNEYRGNVWDDYNEIDLDEDGIGDTPYKNNGVNDLYPLGVFLKPPNKPCDPSPEDLDVGLKNTLSVKVVDPENSLMDVYFYRITNESHHTLIGVDKNIESGGVASTTFNLYFDTIFVWYANVTDGKLQNQSDIWIFSTRERPEDNVPPIADAGGPYHAQINENIEFNASSSSDPDGEIEYYRWNFGDGSSEILEENPIHVYQNPGEYQVSLTVIDNDGSSATDNTYVIVKTQENNPPVAKFTLTDGPFGSKLEEAKTGQQIYFDSAESYDPDGDGLNIVWDFGNGETSIEKYPTYSYPSPGTYIVSLTISDGEYTDVATTVITIKAKSSESPGFEMLLIFAAILLIFTMRQRKK